MSNFFDQFDEPAGNHRQKETNFFDQFDSSPQSQIDKLSHVDGLKPQPEWSANATPEKSVNPDDMSWVDTQVNRGKAILDSFGNMLGGTIKSDAAIAATRPPMATGARFMPPGGQAFVYPSEMQMADRERAMTPAQIADDRAKTYQALTKLGDQAADDSNFGYKDLVGARYEQGKQKISDGKWLSGAVDIVSAGLDGVANSAAMWVPGTQPAAISQYSGEIIQNRVNNTDGKDVPTTEDLGIGLAAGTAMTALEMWLPARLIKAGKPVAQEEAKQISEKVVKHVAKQVLKEAGKDAGVEGFTEALQNGVVQYVSEHWGTDAGIDFDAMAKQAVDGFVLGAAGGGALGAAKGVHSGVSEVGQANKLTQAERSSDMGVDQPANGESLGGGIVDDIQNDQHQVGPVNPDTVEAQGHTFRDTGPLTVDETQASGAQQAPGAFEGVAQYAEQQRAQQEAQRRAEETAWLNEDTNLADAARAYGERQGFITKSPDQIEAEINAGDPDIEAELSGLMADLDHAEALAKSKSAEPSPNFFDQFDQSQPVEQAPTESAAPVQQAMPEPPQAADQPAQSELMPIGEAGSLGQQYQYRNSVPPQPVSEQKLPEQVIAAPEFQEQKQESPQQQDPQSSAEKIDAAAAEAATSPENNLPEPTDAQKEAGNYKKAHVNIQGLDVSIENPRGSTRSGTDPNGKDWSVTMHNHYGYIKRTEGADGDHVDVFIGPNPDSQKVFVVDQVNQDGGFDEHKILLGFDSKMKARSGYKSNYSSGWKVGPITSMTMDEFKSWLKNGDTKKPLAPQLNQEAIKSEAREIPQPEPDSTPIDKETQNEKPQPSAGVSVSDPSKMSVDDIKAEINKLSDLAERRAQEEFGANHQMRPPVPKSGFEYLTTEERGRLHKLKQALPSAGEEQAAARSRLAERLAARKEKKQEQSIPPIITETRAKYISRMAKESGIQKGSPGYADAMKRVESEYERELDKAQAGLPFEEFNRLNGDSPESVNRQAWEALRDEHGISENLYSLGESGKGLSKRKTQEVIDSIRKSWKNPHLKIEAAENIDDMPPEVKAIIDADGVPNHKVKAFFHNGSVYVNSSTMKDAADVERAVFHEVHGHYGARALFGKGTSVAMGRLYLAIGGEKGMKDIAKRHGVDLSKYEKILKNAPAAKRIETMVNELLAHIAQDGKPSVKRFLQELIGTIRTWLRAHGFSSLGQFSDSEIMALLKRTREAATDLKLDGGSIAKVLLDEKAGKGESMGDAQPAYSLSGLPPKTRKIIGSDPLLAAWTLLAQHDGAFQLPVSEQKGLVDIFKELEGERGYTIERDDTIAKTANYKAQKGWLIRIPVSEAQQQRMRDEGEYPTKYRRATVLQNGKSVWIDISDGIPGADGKRVYNAVANYAYNNGLVFIGDPAGLSDAALSRRLENMISSALKFGTTKHLWPHERQVLGDKIVGVPGLAWKDGDDAGNLKNMIMASYEATKNQFPEIEDLRYNPEKARFEDSSDGSEYTADNFRELAESQRSKSGGESLQQRPGESGKVRGTITAGRASLERAVLTHSILRGTREEKSQLLASLSHERPERLTGEDNAILYSLSDDEETRPSGGFSVSGAMEKLGFGKDRRGEGLPPNVRGAYEKLGGKNKTFATKIKQEIKRQFAPGGNLPSEIFDLKIARDSEMNADDSQQRFILEDFYHQIQEVYHKPYSQLRAGTRAEIDAYLKGDRSQVQLTDSMVEVLGRMRRQIQSLSSRYIDQLLIDAADLELKGKTSEAAEKRRLIETITGNFDNYLHRSYRAFDDKDWPKKVPADVYKAAVDFLAGQYAGDSQVSSEDIARATKKIDLMLHEGTAYDSMARFIAEGKLGSKDLSALKKRKQIAPEIRALLGEYQDPAINYAKSVTKMSRLVSNTAFLRQMKDLSLELGYLFEEADRPVGAHKKIAAEASEVYSPLNGLYTFPEFEQALRDSVGNGREPDWYKWLVAANGTIKYGKTVLAPTTAMRNFFSASMFALTAGHYDLRHLDKSVKVVKTYFTGKDVRGSREYVTKLLKLGVLYDAPNYRELQDLIKQVNESESFLAEKLRKSKAATVLNYAQEFYALGDDFWKILGFENEKSMLMTHYNMNESEAEKEAAERIRNTYPTYSMTGRAIQTLRRFPLIGSFPSFPAEIIRTTFHKFRYFHKDARALGFQNPAVISRGVGLAIGAGLMGAISAISAALAGVDDDEDEAIRQMLPEWSRNSNLLFLGRDSKGQVEYMDLTWLDPYAYWKKPISALARDRELLDRAEDSAWEAASPFVGQDIAFGSLLQFIDDWNNPGVTHEKSAEKLGKSLAPGVIGNFIGFWQAAHDTVTKSGKRYSFEDEALALLGFRKGTLNAKVGLTYQAYGYQDKKRAAATVLRDKATDLGKVDIDDLRDAYAKSKEMHKEAWDEMRRIVKLAMKTGMTKADAISALRTSGISRSDAKQIVFDQEFHYKPSKTMMKLAIKRASVLFDKETQNELKERTKSLRELQVELEEKPIR